MAHTTLKKALATPCKACGGLPEIGDDLYNGGMWLLVCKKCGAESLSGCRRHYATDSWYAMNQAERAKEK